LDRWPLEFSIVELDGTPTTIKSDNGARLVPKKVKEWIENRHNGARFIDPGSPWKNGHNESFGGVFRAGCLNRWLFESVREAREAIEARLYEYNVERPHGSLSGRSPELFFEQWEVQQGKQLDGQAKFLSQPLVSEFWACQRLCPVMVTESSSFESVCRASEIKAVPEATA
jgi:hypothetical protein